MILPGSVETARHYGIIKSQLKKKGRPIPENDVWIAAIAKEYDLTLVTRDDHFSYIGETITLPARYCFNHFLGLIE